MAAGRSGGHHDDRLLLGMSLLAIGLAYRRKK